MKYIIILLTSLFLVSNASADDDIKNMKDICKYYKQRAIGFHNTLLFFEKTDSVNLVVVKEAILKNAKLYHYYGCSDVR